jgi:N-methylhydantoinase A
MADLVRKATVERGHDPRDFVILAFGGSGPTHCTAYGAEIGAKKIVVPRYASVFSAYGIAQADIKHSLMRSMLVLLPQHEIEANDDALARLNGGFSKLACDVESQPAEALGEGGAAILSYAVDCRFKGQSTQITVPVMRLPLLPDDLRSIVARFKTLYEMSYGAGASSPTSPIELVNLRAEIIVPSGSQLDPTPATAVTTTSVDTAIKGRRAVYWGRSSGWGDTPVYDGERLGFGHEVHGPALVELFKSTAPIYEGQRATVDAYRNLVIESVR